MKLLKIYIYLQLFLLVFLGFGAVVLHPHINERIKQEILNRYTTLDLGPLDIKNVDLKYTWPPQLHVEGVKADIVAAYFKINVPSLTLTVRPTLQSWSALEELSVEVLLEDMKYDLTLLPPPPPGVNTKAAASPGLPIPTAKAQAPRLNLQFISKNGAFEIKQQQVVDQAVKTILFARGMNENIKLSLDDALNENKKLQIDYGNDLEMPAYLGERKIKLKIKTTALNFKPPVLSSDDLGINFAGVDLLGQGQVNFDKGTMDWQIKINLPEIEKLPIPPAFLPPGEWRGGILGLVKILRAENSPIEISGHIKGESLKGDINLQQPDVSVRGPVSPAVRVEFVYRNGLTLPVVDFAVDATQLDMRYKDLFIKPVGVPLTVKAKATGEGATLEFKNLDVQLDQLVFGAKGVVNIQESRNANLLMRVSPVSLMSLAPYILPLKKSPVAGSFEALAQITGADVNIKKLELISKVGVLGVSGVVEDYLNPKLRLSINLAGVKLREVSQFSEALKPYGLDGVVNGQLTVTGPLDRDFNIEKSTLAIKGHVITQMNKYRVTPPAVAKAPTPVAPTASVSWEDFQKQQAALPEAQPLLPNWPIIKNANITLRATLKEFQYGHQLTAQGLSFAGTFARDTFIGQTKIDKIFSGSMNWSRLEVQNMTLKPVIIGEGSVQNLQLVEIIKFVSPQNMRWVEGGALTTQVNMRSPIPQTKNWLMGLVSSGLIKVKQLHTKENAIEQLMGEKLARFAKDKQILSKKGVPFIADVDSQFTVQGGRANIQRFHFLTIDKNEFEARGTARVDMMAELKGTLHLATADIQGDVRAANSDAQGRFVIPVEFSGSLLNPSYSVAAEALQTVAQKTLAYEGKKLKQGLKEKLKDKKTQEQLKQSFKKIFE